MLVRFMGVVKTFVAGLFMGVAGLVPGVSSGTVAVVAGVYQRMIDAFGSFFSKGKEKARHLLFLVPLIAGVVIATFIFANVVERVLKTYPNQVSMFMIGLIIGTTPVLYKKVRKMGEGEQFHVRNLLPLLFALVLVVWLNLPDRAATTPLEETSVRTFALLFMAGFLAAGTGLVPGISGAMVLLVIGVYATLISAISAVNWPLLIAIATGALAGFIVFSKTMHYLTHNFRQTTYCTIIGFLVGSAISIFPSREMLAGSLPLIVSYVALLGSGAILAYFYGGERRRV